MFHRGLHVFLAVLSLGIVIDGGPLSRDLRQRLAHKRHLTTRPVGCEYEGKYYPPGSEFGNTSYLPGLIGRPSARKISRVERKKDEGYDKDTNWCFGAFCSEQGQVIHWDNFNCKSTSTTTSPSPTTRPTTTTPTTTPISPTKLMCHYNDRLYPPNTEIDSGYDSSSDWCYGTYCDRDGTVLAWDTWNCKRSTSTTSSTTGPPPTTLLPSSSEDSEENDNSWLNNLKKLKNKLKKLLAFKKYI